MKLEILRDNLKMGLSAAERIVSRNISLPILQDVLLDTEDSFLVFISTDLETAITLWVLTKIIKKGKVVVPAKFLSSVVGTLPNEKITLEVKGQNLHIECKGLKTQVQGHNSDEFPIIPKFDQSEYVQVNAAALCRGLSQVIDVPVTSQSRPEISGIYFSFSKNTITIAATDSFRLAEKHIILETPVKKDYIFILPSRPSREIMNILDGKEGDVKIHISNNQVLFELGFKDIDHPQARITSRLIDGEYPHYQDIIPTSFKTHIIVKREELLNNMKTASLFSGKVNEVKLSANPEKKELGIFAKSADLGENESTLPSIIEGEAMDISFNYKYVVDGLTHIQSSEITLDMSKEDGPCVIRPVGDASYVYVVMPIKPM